MTDSEKVFALTEILGDVIHTLELKQYDIEDPQLSHDCVTDADKFQQRMMDILYPKENWSRQTLTISFCLIMSKQLLLAQLNLAENGEQLLKILDSLSTESNNNLVEIES